MHVRVLARRGQETLGKRPRSVAPPRRRVHVVAEVALLATPTRGSHATRWDGVAVPSTASSHDQPSELREGCARQLHEDNRASSGSSVDQNYINQSPFQEKTASSTPLSGDKEAVSVGNQWVFKTMDAGMIDSHQRAITHANQHRHGGHVHRKSSDHIPGQGQQRAGHRLGHRRDTSRDTNGATIGAGSRTRDDVSPMSRKQTTQIPWLCTSKYLTV